MGGVLGEVCNVTPQSEDQGHGGRNDSTTRPPPSQRLSLTNVFMASRHVKHTVKHNILCTFLFAKDYYYYYYYYYYY